MLGKGNIGKELRKGMLKELRKLREKNKPLATYIYRLQGMGKIGRYTKNGVCAYDTEELKSYRKVSRRGRPRKDITITIQEQEN